MPEIARLTGVRDWIDLDVVERERTPQPAMALGIQSYLAGLSLSNTVDLLDALGVQRSRKAIHDWVQKADLQPEAGQSPNQIALDEAQHRQTALRRAGSDFRCVATEIGTLPNGFFESQNAGRRRFRTASVTSNQPLPSRGPKSLLAGTMH